MINIKNAVFVSVTGAAIGLGSLGFAATASADSGEVSAQGTTRTSVQAVPRTFAPKFNGPSSRFGELKNMFGGGPSRFGAAQQECGLIKANDCLRR